MGRPAVGNRPFDPVVVNVLAAGRPVAGYVLSPDAWEAVRRLARRGYSDGQIAYIVGRTRKQVQRIRTALGVPAPCWRRGGSSRPIQGAPSRPKGAG